MSKSKVYFTKVISPEKMIEMFKILNKELKGNVAVKVHTGEKGNKNFIKPEFLKPIVEYVKGTVVECNTAYPGERNSTEKHLKLIEEHEWTKYFKVDIMDSEGDEKYDIPNGLKIKENYLGKHIKNYDSCLVISRFKGHGFGGFGGALKQLSIGFGSSQGKTIQHTAGVTKNQEELFKNLCDIKVLKETMADAAWTVTNYFKDNMAFITIMCNIGIDCDCDKNAKPPCMKDIGILSSTDPVALDKACLDLVYNSEDPGKEELIKRIDEKFGKYIIECANKLGIGNNEYELIKLD